MPRASLVFLKKSRMLNSVSALGVFVFISLKGLFQNQSRYLMTTQIRRLQRLMGAASVLSLLPRRARRNRGKFVHLEAMASSHSTESHSGPDTSSGPLGSGGNVTKHYSNVTVYVNEISKRSVGKEKLKRCGNEGRNYQHYVEGTIDYEEYLEIEITKQILEAFISFIPDAEEDGADLTNAAFIVSQPGRSFVVLAGDGDWEYVFEREYDGKIYGRCVRKP